MPKLDCLILVNGEEVHITKFGEDTYSDDPIFISDVQSDFDRLWNIDENDEEKRTAPASRKVTRFKRMNLGRHVSRS
ncbi:MAG: hypothetical protein ACRD8W_12250 [Nitrososphaeraceae archaeon]